MLATIRAQDTDVDPFEVQAEDELPYVQLGHWMGLADVSATAKELYWILAMHLNYKRGDRYVWPSTEILAMLLGYSRGDKITPFTRELESIGALTVIKVPDGRGPQKKNVYKLRRTPPEHYTGPRSLGEFYERLGKAYDGAVLDDIQHLNSIEPGGQTVSPEPGGHVSPRSGGHVGPESGAYVGPQLGAVTTRSINKKKDNEGAPSARSATDARRASTGSSARENGGSAASTGAKAPKKSPSAKNQVRMTQQQGADVRTVEQGYPAELAACMPGYRPPAVRDAILATLGRAPSQRTAEQLAARVERRWYAWGFDEKHREGAILSYPGVVIRLISLQPCGNDRCEDGQVIDTGDPCRACAERKIDRRSDRRNGVPVQRTADPRPAPSWWECGQCRRPGRDGAPADGLCGSCRNETEDAAPSTAHPADEPARGDRLRKEEAAASWTLTLQDAYEEHEQRGHEAARRHERVAAAAARRAADEEESRLLRDELTQQYPELASYRQT
ncbi:hypothetical protein [Streptomyces sp. NPDC018833]|uniref:hypothetical protein n=1 Tax=Streptomyces sp. NPDC018833 TaxID=3365053 RepID=UPI0037A7CD5E